MPYYANGAEFIRAFTGKPEFVEIPIIVITVYEGHDFRIHGRSRRNHRFFSEPGQSQGRARARNLLKLRKRQLLLEPGADVGRRNCLQRV